MTASVNTSYRASNDAVGLNTAQTNVTWTVNSSGISINGAGYAGTGTSATNASITLNSDGLAINVAAPGGAITLSGYSPPQAHGMLQVTQTIGNGSVNLMPMSVPAAFQFDNFMMPIQYSNGIGSSGQLSMSFYVGIYTRNGSTLSRLHSSSSGFSITNAGTTGIYSSISGIRLLPMGWTSTITAGNYWIGIGLSTSTSLSNMSISSFVASNQGSNANGVFGLADNSTRGINMIGQGRWTGSSGSAPDNIQLDHIVATGSAQRRPTIYFFQSQTF